MTPHPPDPPRSTLTPPPTYPTHMSSPPLSPSSSLAEPSDDDLSDWTEVDSGTELESVHPSLLGDISDVSSDSGSEPRRFEHPSGSDADESDVENDDRGVLIHSPSLQGSYTDAEATDPSSTSKLGSSIGTIHDGLTPSSSIQLVFPDPGASFSTSSGTLSRGHTPHGSTAALISDANYNPRPRAGTIPDKSTKYSPRRGSSPVRNGINESWLRSSNLWEPPQGIQNDPHTASYHLLSSTDDVEDVSRRSQLNDKAEDLQLFQAVDPIPVPADTNRHETHSDTKGNDSKVTEEKGVVSPIQEKREVGSAAPELEQTLHQLRQAIATAAAAGIKGGAKKWLPVLALASVLSLAFFGPFRSSPLSDLTTGSINALPSVKPIGQPVTTPDDVSSPSTIQAATPGSVVDSLSSVKMIPDLQLIRQALSTLSTVHSKPKSAPEARTTEAGHSPEVNTPVGVEKDGQPSTSCYSIAVRDNNVALTIPPSKSVSPAMPTNKGRSWRQKLLRSSSAAVPALSNSSTISPNRSEDCAPIVISVTPYGSSPLGRIQSALIPAKNYTLTAGRYFNQALSPIVHAVEEDFSEIYHLTYRSLHSATVRTQMILERAARGSVVAQTYTKSVFIRFQDNMKRFFSSHQPKPDEALLRAQAMYDTLSEYVEDQLEQLSDMVEEQAEAVHNNGLYVIKRARRGLDQLIVDAKRLTPGGGREVDQEGMKVKMEVAVDGPLPFIQNGKGQRRERMSRERRPRTVRRDRGKGRQGQRHQEMEKENVYVPPPPQSPSKARRFLDLVHHGAVALVL